MSVKTMTWAFSQPIGGNEKVVLLALADFADDEGVCWPSIRTLAGKAYTSEATVKRIMLKLIEHGYLESVQRHNDDGRSLSNLYRLLVDWVGAQIEPVGAHSCEGGRGSLLNPHNEPSLEPSSEIITTQAREVPSKTKNKGTRVPEAFFPNPASFKTASDLQIPSAEVHDAVASFLDYWRGVPGSKGLKLDWQATFRNQLRHIAKTRKPHVGNRKNTFADSFAIVNAAIESQIRREAEDGFDEHGEDASGIPRLRQITA